MNKKLEHKYLIWEELAYKSEPGFSFYNWSLSVLYQAMGKTYELSICYLQPK